ncbi:hypothetical protein [Trinickia fusca]|uniref:Uncharacterized protein n=1 Tax=Trinickia fusca TaxID=2419777 RepID=A0A494XKH4_9BURK|nr:hypothetical protein [Trinickia fusca]RKP51088.1 hypothetical protein D7S89_08570 [Trinickia fusca]
MSQIVVHVSNQTSRDLFVAGDPNWDDQALLVDGQPFDRAYRLAAKASADISMNWAEQDTPGENMMGVIVADGTDYDYGSAGAYQMTIGRHPETGLLGVTQESTLNDPTVRHVDANGTPWSMQMSFVDR